MDLRETLSCLKTDKLLISSINETVIELSGEDARDWLQGQITQDISLLTDGGHISSCICSPTGQLLTIVHIYERSGNLLLVTPNPEVILNLVENFVIMEDVTARVVTTSLVSAQGNGAENLGKHYLPRDRTGFGGFDVFDPNPKDLQMAPLNPEHLDALEITVGIPRFGIEITSKTLPPELGSKFDSTYIHYQKGCYAGQEVLQRIHSRGHTNKTWVGLLSNNYLPAGEKVNFEGAEVGVVLRSANNPDHGFISSAIVKNVASQPGTSVTVDGISATVEHLPLIH